MEPIQGGRAEFMAFGLEYDLWGVNEDSLKVCAWS